MDFDIKVVMFCLCLKEQKEKVYDFDECSRRIAYIFNDKEEFRNYFINNGYRDISDDVLKLCKLKTGKSGKILALKALCDHTITRFRHPKDLSQEEIEEIHKRGNITPMEKVDELMALGVCIPGDAIGSAINRCKTFDSCSDCLVHYVSDRDEYTKTSDNFKVVNYYNPREEEFVLKKI